MDSDLAIRLAAIQHCRLLSERWGEAVPARELRQGFVFHGDHIKLMGIQGIFKPKQLRDGPLTLLSTLASSYDDEQLEGDELLYDYAPAQREYENDGLKRIAELGRSVILLKQVTRKPRSEYMIFAPVALLGFDDGARKVHLDLGAALSDGYGLSLPSVPMPSSFSKAYAETITRARLHQAHFRRATLSAYRNRCCVCTLRERPLLDAAHIVPDRLPEGVPEVRNGMAMCPTHHRAYDRGIMLVSERYQIEVPSDRLRHVRDEPTQRLLLDYHGREIARPRDESLAPTPALLRRKLELVQR